ncbi:GntG family PLP-dependent aldolase [Cloacibacillus sp.]|uniref:threonine aldolase family protein n=1 Tax=Cloacibacillus sp. TaxID=2049023 RepID=UPI0025C61D3E|nr:GntG family PLP-dependent aldolase [Cloacibacillus sp.]MCC8057377.1 threonine aldolase [Cloacibacillus sp.]
MYHKIMDFRSDTVTRPSEEMRRVIAAAEVGDDIYGDDPSSNALCKYAAEITGKEAAIFACSGTMGNLLAFTTAGRHGESLLAGKRSHVWCAEVGGFSSVAGLCPYPLVDDEGVPDPAELAVASRADNDVHHPDTTILALENTHNYTGGIAVPPDRFAQTAREGRRLGFHVHLDGARIFNAAVRHGVDVRRYTDEVDSVQFCLSKGLGAPLGSMLCGSHELIEGAKKWRKRLGGAQRQVGIAAAAGLYALKNNVARLAEDHANAALLVDLLKRGGVEVEERPNMTNMVFFPLKEGQVGDAEFEARCLEKGLLAHMISPRRARFVTHLDVDREDVERAAAIILEVLSA